MVLDSQAPDIIIILLSMIKIILSFFCMLFSANLYANTIINKNPLKLKNSFFSTEKAEVTSEVELQINVLLAEKHHAYTKQFKLTPKNSDIKVRPLIVNPTIEFYDKLAKKNKFGIKDEATLKTSFEVPQSLADGMNKLKFTLQYQACTKEYCLMPIDIEFSSPLNVVNPNFISPVEAKTSTSLFNIESFDLSGENTSIFIILFGIFLAGILTSFTPCIYPMIPITMAVLGSSKTENKLSRRLFLSISYVLGIACTYSILGVIAASTGGLFGAYLNHPFVRVGITLLFIIMALSMFGLFELQAPAFIRNKIANKQFEQNYIGAFLTGLVAGIIASPCVGPVLFTILAFVASSGDLTLGFLYLFVFALGLGLIFIVIGVFSHVLNKLPRSGPWMELTKYLFGVIMLGAAAYYIAPLLSHKLFYLFSFIPIAIAIYFCIKLINNKVLKSLFLISLFSLSVFSLLNIIPGTSDKISQLLEKKDPLAPKWQTYNDDLIKEAADKGYGVIIDFYADWCAACIELENKTFNQPNIHKLGQKFYWLKFDATNISDDYKRLRDKYNILGLPHIVFYNPNGINLKHKTLIGFENAEEFEKRLNEVLEP